MRHAKIQFSDIERIDLLKAWVATSLAFAVYFAGNVAEGLSSNSFPSFTTIFLLAASTAGVGFIGHELMHKFTANHFGVAAEFHSNDRMLVLSILISFLGVIFAAPGAVMIMGNVTKRENGIISLAGPAANMVFAILFALLLATSHPLLHIIGATGFLINAMLGMFNMIPLPGFDGSKVLYWNKPIYFSLLAIGIVQVMLAFVVLG